MMSRRIALLMAASIAPPAAIAGCNEIFGVNDLVVVETGGGGSGGATGGSGGAPCGGECPLAECCSGACVDLASDPAHCGQCGTACKDGVEKCCGGACTDITLDEANCGACGTTCPGTICFGGECSTTCAAPFENCDQNIALNGCEADLKADVANCGSCAIACPAGAICAGGVCVCPENMLDCDGNPLNGCETDVTTDPASCGQCGKSCGPGQLCESGTCACAPGLGDCNSDPNDGCEAPLDSVANCGACGAACGPHMICMGNVCACREGFLDCTNQPGCESPASSPTSCGMCDVKCTGNDVCNGMACVAGCGAGQTLCGGSCVNLATSALHCGACDTPVGPNRTCVGAMPVCLPGFADCTTEPGCETDTKSDAASCGGCGIACKPGAVCAQGMCVCAAMTPKDCGADCRTCCSNADCGDGNGCTTDTCAPDGLSCAHAPCAGGTQCCSQIACAQCCTNADCAPNEACSGGLCSEACPVGLALCGGSCVQTQTDPNHCNGCNIKCGSDGTCACSGGACSGGTIYFSEDFSDNFKGWTLGTEWGIGPAVQGSGQEAGNPDPAMDRSASSDNGIAGVVIGGNFSTTPHAPYYLVSPTINLSAAVGPVKLTFYRWLNAGVSSGTSKVVHKVEITTGGNYTTLWDQSGVFMDAAWVKQELDVTAFKSATTKLRFSFAITGGSGSVSSMSGLNIDDVTLSSGTCN